MDLLVYVAVNLFNLLVFAVLVFIVWKVIAGLVPRDGMQVSRRDRRREDHRNGGD